MQTNLNFDTQFPIPASDKELQAVLDMVNNPTDHYQDDLRIFRTKKASAWIDEAKNRPDPQALWKSFWYEGEVCCLFADSNLGKSIYAVEIAEHIARTQPVLYMDFELTDKQFQMRYTDESGHSYPFHYNLNRSEINAANLLEDFDWESMIIEEIRMEAEHNDCKVLIIDNISYLNSLTEKAEAADRLMKSLAKLKREYGLSLLILAHTPKRGMGSAINQNDIAGSKKIFNYMDSVFAIGKSTLDENLRYLKQVKARHGAIEHGSDNVIIAEIVKDGSWLHFVERGCGSERDLLKEQSVKEENEAIQRAIELHQQGMSIRDIAKEVHLSKSTVQREIGKYKALIS